MKLRKPGKKQIIISASVLLVLATAGTSYALVSGRFKSDTQSHVSQVEVPKETKSEVKEAETVRSNVVEAEPVQVTTSEPEPAQPAVQPIYGKDPNTDELRVFDRTAVMNEAGVPTEQQATATQLISLINPSWQYGIYNKVFEGDNICRALPDSKMQGYGSDYETNAVTQLKWCNGYVIGRYGNWQAALDRKVNNGFF